MLYRQFWADPSRRNDNVTLQNFRKARASGRRTSIVPEMPPIPSLQTLERPSRVEVRLTRPGAANTCPGHFYLPARCASVRDPVRAVSTDHCDFGGFSTVFHHTQQVVGAAGAVEKLFRLEIRKNKRLTRSSFLQLLRMTGARNQGVAGRPESVTITCPLLRFRTAVTVVVQD